LGDAGAFLTEDGGSTFKNLKTPSYLSSNAAKAGAFDWTADSNIIVTVTGNNTEQRIIVTRNADSSTVNWTTITGSEANYRFIAFHPTNNNVVYAGRYRFDSIQTNNNYTTLTKTVNAMYGGDGDIVYSLASSGANTTIYKSTDKGTTWTSPYTALPASIGNVGQIVVDPANADKFYVAVSYAGVYILNGSTWSLKDEDNGLVKDWLPNLYTQFVVVDPNDTDVLYAGSRPGSSKGHGNGIFRSIDGGETWTNITGNLGPEITPWALTVNPYDSYIYLGSSHGTWKLSPPGTTNTDTTWAFQQDAGQQGIVAIEAEHYHANISQGGHDWVAAFNSGYSGDGAIEATPNSGATVNTGYVTNSPRLDFQVEFVKTGTHYLWARGMGPNSSDDSCHAGLDGAETTSSDRISGFGSSWGWQRSTMDGSVATFNITSTGVHTVNVWMREDGFVLDKLVITTDSDYTPSWTGPVESPRVTPTVETSTITPAGGAFNDSVSVTLSTGTADASSYYTLDGGDPTTASTVYSGLFTINSSWTVKARAFLSGYNDSGIASAAFTINPTPTITITSPTTNSTYSTTQSTIALSRNRF